MIQFKQVLFSLVLLCLGTTTFAQVKVGNNPTTINTSSVLEVESTNKGFLPPRMTEAQRDAIVSPAQGLIIFNTTVPCLQINDGTPAVPDWNCMSGATTGPNASTNGTGIVSTYGGAGCTGSGTINGTLTAGTPVSGVTMSLYANVTTLGTYNLFATQNGVTFSGTGTFTALGCQLITLTASGTPTTAGATTWNTNSTPIGSATATVAAAGPPFPAGYVPCDGVTTVVQDVTSPTGKTWMDRNLGASRVPVNQIDVLGYGDLYQWGRFADGHQCRTSGTIETIATTAVPNAGNPWDGLVIFNLIGPAYDWLTPSNDNLWQGVSGINNPCPSGYRLPTEAEWDAERITWSSNDATGAFNSPLKLTQDIIAGSAAVGDYWSSSVIILTNLSHLLRFTNVNAYVPLSNRYVRASVRCIKN